MIVTDWVVMQISSHEDVVMKIESWMDVVMKKLVMNSFPTKIAGEIPGYMNCMGEIYRWVNSCMAMVTTPVAGVSL